MVHKRAREEESLTLCARCEGGINFAISKYAYNEFGLYGGQPGDQSDLSPLPSVSHTRKVGYLTDGRVNVRRVFLPRVFVEESHKS